MKKLLTYGAIGILSLLTVTSMLRMNNGIDLFMTSSVVQDVARILLILALIATLFVEDRPRTVVFQGVFAIVAVALVAYVAVGLAGYGLQFFDAVAYLLSAVILFSEAVNKEVRVKPLKTNQPTI